MTSKRKGSPNMKKFVKKASNIPCVEFLVERPCRTAFNLAECGLIGQFSCLWPSPKDIDGWLHRNWRPLISEGIRNHLVGRGYYVFVFELAEDRDLIFCNGPYFMGP